MTPHNRSLLDQGLGQLRDNIIRLAGMVDTAIERAMLALQTRNIAMAHDVIAHDSIINQLRYDIEQECLRIVATQQPAAGDLRNTLAAIHIAVELERMGDHAAGIARLVERMVDEPAIDNLHKIPKMAKRARQMMQEGIDAYVQHNADLAYAMIKRDDKIDKQYRQLFEETLQEMKNATYVTRATYLLWVGHNLERIGDRATNIAERVIFMVKGEFVEPEHDEVD